MVVTPLLLPFLARPYQNEGVGALWQYFINSSGNPLLGLPTGTGKSYIPPLFMKRAFQEFPNSRFMVVTHVKELIKQNASALRKVWPTAPYGICSAGLKKWQPHCPIILAGIASVYKRALEIGYIDILFIDEAQLVGPEDAAMYQQFIAALRMINPHLKVIGLSATLFRMGQGMLTDKINALDDQGKPIQVDPIFTDVAFDMTGESDFTWFIDQYYLSNLVTPNTSNKVDVSDVRQLASDFHQGDMQATVESVTQKSLEEAVALAGNRRSWMVFGAGVENCHHINDLLNKMGVTSVVVHSDHSKYPLDDDTRDARIQAFRYGQARAIVSYGILTTGFDHPLVDCIIDLRPTTSVVLHIQKYGRGTRPYYHPDWNFERLRYRDERYAAMCAGGKLDCLVLDFAGNTTRLGEINNPTIPRGKGAGGGDAPIKVCDECGAPNNISTKFCVLCGHEFMFRVKIKDNASQQEVIKWSGGTVDQFDVERVTKRVHKKAGRPPSLKVTYFCKNRDFSTWLSFEPDAKPYAKKIAAEFWRQHRGEEVPQSTQEAFDWFDMCRVPRKLKVAFKPDKWPEIQEYIF